MNKAIRTERQNLVARLCLIRRYEDMYEDFDTYRDTRKMIDARLKETNES